VEADYWIGKKDLLLRRAKMQAKIIDENRGVNVGIEIRLSEFNKPVKVEVPKDYMNAEELMGTFAPLFQGPMK